jgi:S1-C subfamily serine protease
MRTKRGVSKGYWALLAVAVVLASLITYSAVSIMSSPQQTTTSSAQLTTTTSGQVGGTPDSGGANFLGLDPVAIYAQDSASVVTIEGVQSGSPVLGSGFVYAYQGSNYVITNFHVVQNDTDLTTTFQDGNAYPTRVVGTDGYSDLAVVSVSAPSSEFHPLQITSSSLLKVGQPVVAIGNPFGLSGSMTFGIVSQLGRTLTETLAGPYSIANVIQFSAPINPGNSGGPLFSGNGTVIGITTATVQSSQGVGFAIPSDTILKELPSLVSTGGYTGHSLMGVSTVDMTYQLAQLQGTNVTYGVLIENVTAGGPAAKAGLRAGSHSTTVQGSQYAIGGDIIIALNGTKILNSDGLSSYLQEYTVPGQTVIIQIIRGGHQMSVNLVLGTRPPAPSG